jgi:hypothetical protein
MLNDPLGVAFFRALATAAISAIAAAVATYQAGGGNSAIMAAGITAFVAPLITRGAGEGLYDSNRRKTNDVKPSDVGFVAAGQDGKPDKDEKPAEPEAEIMPILAPFWVEVGMLRNLRVLGIRTDRKTGKREYLVAAAGGQPRLVPEDRVDQVIYDKPTA